jgi:tripartite-type tricarboxylate transporter receptor subunit TctC
MSDGWRPGRRGFLLGAAALGSGAGAARAQTAGFAPSRPVTLVVNSPAGGSTDFSARLVAEPLSARLGVPVVVENRPGGAGVVGVQHAARARPDGHTLLVGYSGTITGWPPVRGTADFDPQRDFAPIALLTEAPQVMMVHPSVPVATLPEFIAHAKARPGQLAYGSSGNGSLQHLGTELLKHRTGIDLLHVSYRGTGETIADFLSGRLQFYMTTPPPVLASVREGKLRAMASPRRHPSLPDVPTTAEAGLADYAAEAWFGLFAPIATPPEIIARYAREAEAVLSEPAVANRALEAGAFARFEDPATLKARVERETASWTALVQAVDIKSPVKYADFKRVRVAPSGVARCSALPGSS